MSIVEITRRRFLSGLAGISASVPMLGARAVAGQQTASGPNRPLVVTSKTNRFVREEITTTAWDTMRDGGSAMDAAEKGTNISERDPRDATVGYGVVA